MGGTHLPHSASHASRSLGALGVVIGMGVFYTWLDGSQPEEPLLTVASLLPGIVGVAAVRAAGATRTDLYLRVGRLTKPGALLLGGVTVLLVPILASTSGFLGWRWLPALVYAPASGVAQELYFRSALLPALERALGGRKRGALLIHAALFVFWHLRTFRSLPNVPVALLVACVLFAAGSGWGRQVQHDRTVVWAAVQHSLFLVLMSLFDWG